MVEKNMMISNVSTFSHWMYVRLIIRVIRTNTITVILPKSTNWSPNTNMFLPKFFTNSSMDENARALPQFSDG